MRNTFTGFCLFAILVGLAVVAFAQDHDAGHAQYHDVYQTWKTPGSGVSWGAFHRDLGQELARRLRVYPGPSTDPDGGDIGGTPVMMRMAA